MEIFSEETLISLINAVGYLGVFAIVFAESGLLIGVFLPGDSLLFTAGFLASQGFMNIYGLLAVIFAGAVLGDSVGYTFGYRVGRKIFRKDDSLIFKQANLRRAEDFYDKHGPVTIILARFVPIVRSFAPIIAGVGKMRYRSFLLYNVVGGLLWTLVMTLAGYLLTEIFPGIGDHLFLVVGLIIFLSILPPLWHVWRTKQKASKEAAEDSEPIDSKR